MKRTLLMALLALSGGAAQADCVCRCVNGQVQAICSSPLDLRPLCAPQLCPITPPTIRPLQMPQLPPLGASSCEQRQVLNPYTGRYEWRTLCQ